MTMGFYVGMLLATLILLLGFIRSGLKVNIYYTLTFVTVVIANIGYFSVAFSSALEEALLANRLTYIGGVFLPFFFFYVVSDLCRIKISNFTTTFLVCLSFAILFFTFSPGHSKLYYASVELHHSNGISYLVKEYGPFHNVYIVYWAGYMLALMVVIGVSIFWQQLVSYKTIIILGILVAFNILTYLFERMLGFDVELMPLSYLISELLILIRLRSINLYDMSSNVMNVIKRRSEYGYFTFTTDLKFVGYNEFAASIYPEIQSLRIDYPVTQTDTSFYLEIMQWLNELMQENTSSAKKNILHGKQILKCSVKPIIQGNKERHVGYLVEIMDNTEQQNYINMIEKFNVTLENEVDKKTASLQQMQEEIILSFANMVESRDHITGGHIKRSSGYVRILSNKLKTMDLFPEFRDNTYIKHICMAAPLHDIGKIAIPDSILNKPGKYSAEEFEIMKKHPLLGGNILDETLGSLEDQEYYEIAWQMAMFHHENWDGSGYPTGLKGEDIPLCARVMAIADVFDALTTRRPYKKEFSLDKSFAIIEARRGTYFDPRLVDVCLACREEFEELYNQQKKSGDILTRDDLDNLMQTVFAVGSYSNACQVSYAEWGKFVSYAKNLALRNKQAMYLVMFTIESKTDQTLDEDLKRTAMMNLKLAVVSSLRSSDMTTQISNVQRVVMLMNPDTNGIMIVIKRIEDYFYQNNSNEDILLSYVISNPLNEEHSPN